MKLTIKSVRVDVSHSGPPRFVQPDWQTDRIVKVVAGSTERAAYDRPS